MDRVLAEIGHLPLAVEGVLKETSAWVRANSKDPMPLLDVYARAEVSRKDDRARLASNQFGVDRRMEWQGERHGRAAPLHYRWGNVKRLLRDPEAVTRAIGRLGTASPPSTRCGPGPWHR